jgi:hypothetical protein
MTPDMPQKKINLIKRVLRKVKSAIKTLHYVPLMTDFAIFK